MGTLPQTILIPMNIREENRNPERKRNIEQPGKLALLQAWILCQSQGPGK